jgi:hypothetical protein
LRELQRKKYCIAQTHNTIKISLTFISQPSSKFR